jgi:hypothetical protein
VADHERDDKVKHLELIQAIVSRLANNSFLMKGWALTAALAVFTFAANLRSWPLALIGLLPVFSFYWLDAYYLRQERLFRCLYEAVRKGQVEPFLMDHSPYRANEKCTWRSTLLSITLGGFYGSLAGVGVLITIILIVIGPVRASDAKPAPAAPSSTSPAQSPTPESGNPSSAATGRPSDPTSSAGPNGDGSETPTETRPPQTTG